MLVCYCGGVDLAVVFPSEGSFRCGLFWDDLVAGLF